VHSYGRGTKQALRSPQKKEKDQEAEAGVLEGNDDGTTDTLIGIHKPGVKITKNPGPDHKVLVIWKGGYYRPPKRRVGCHVHGRKGGLKIKRVAGLQTGVFMRGGEGDGMLFWKARTAPKESVMAPELGRVKRRRSDTAHRRLSRSSEKGQGVVEKKEKWGGKDRSDLVKGTND